MTRLALLLAAVLCIALTAVAAPAGATRTKTVSLKDVAFTPETARISRGDRVRWVWRDGATPHNVRSRGSRSFKGSSTKTKGSHTVRFPRRGTYRYVCTVHVGMGATVVVR